MEGEDIGSTRCGKASEGLFKKLTGGNVKYAYSPMRRKSFSPRHMVVNVKVMKNLLDVLQGQTPDVHWSAAIVKAGCATLEACKCGLSAYAVYASWAFALRPEKLVVVKQNFERVRPALRTDVKHPTCCPSQYSLEQELKLAGLFAVRFNNKCLEPERFRKTHEDVKNPVAHVRNLRHMPEWQMSMLKMHASKQHVKLTSSSADRVLAAADGLHAIADRSELFQSKVHWKKSKKGKRRTARANATAAAGTASSNRSASAEQMAAPMQLNQTAESPPRAAADVPLQLSSAALALPGAPQQDFALRPEARAFLPEEPHATQGWEPQTPLEHFAAGMSSLMGGAMGAFWPKSST
mmetsp:Transcript_99999/g.164380  ORF Transcript_99999/g.164380 Transcript_99999/m.164380 type:complete len:351 (-) Transcript_99999:75-1127(-)